MTKKDYELIAVSFNRQLSNLLIFYETGFEGWKLTQRESAIKNVANDLAGELAKVDPKFEPKRFLTDCGIQD